MALPDVCPVPWQPWDWQLLPAEPGERLVSVLRQKDMSMLMEPPLPQLLGCIYVKGAEVWSLRAGSIAWGS